jgi:hypothetical protein
LSRFYLTELHSEESMTRDWDQEGNSKGRNSEPSPTADIRGAEMLAVLLVVAIAAVAAALHFAYPLLKGWLG